jgi:hypothetical protein
MQHTVINTSVPTHWLAYRSQRIALARTQMLKIKSSWVMEKCVSLREDSKLGRLRGKWNWLGKDCYDPGSVKYLCTIMMSNMELGMGILGTREMCILPRVGTYTEGMH